MLDVTPAPPKYHDQPDYACRPTRFDIDHRVLALSEGAAFEDVAVTGPAAMGRFAVPGAAPSPDALAPGTASIHNRRAVSLVHLCPECCRGHRISDVLEILGIAEVLRRLDRIEAAINRERKIMASIDEALDALGTQLDDLGTDLARELQDLVTAIGGKLNPDQQAKVDALAGRLTDLKASIDTADPGV